MQTNSFEQYDGLSWKSPKQTFALPPPQVFHKVLSDIMVWCGHSGPHKSSIVIHRSDLLSVISSILYMVQPSLDPPSHLLHNIFSGCLSILLGEQVLV